MRRKAVLSKKTPFSAAGRYAGDLQKPCAKRQRGCLGMPSNGLKRRKIPDLHWKRRREQSAALQSADKARKRKNCPDKEEIRGNFRFLRQPRLRSAATYICVGSLVCKFAFLSAGFSSLRQFVDIVNIEAPLRCAEALLLPFRRSKKGLLRERKRRV